MEFFLPKMDRKPDPLLVLVVFDVFVVELLVLVLVVF